MYCGAICIVCGIPCMCMMMKADLVSAISGIISWSPRPPVTSFTIEAPARIAARATSAFDVSIEIITSLFLRNCSTTGITRCNSSSGATASAPGRVDSPPTSMMCAPSAAIRRPCATAFSASKKFPPSENEFGVIFNTPMISPCRERSKMRSPIFQSLPRIMDETNTPDTLFEAVDVDLWATRHRRAILPASRFAQRSGYGYFFRE